MLELRFTVKSSTWSFNGRLHIGAALITAFLYLGNSGMNW